MRNTGINQESGHAFAVSLQGGCGSAIVHGMDGKVNLGNRLLVLEDAQRSIGLGLTCGNIGSTRSRHDWWTKRRRVFDDEYVMA